MLKSWIIHVGASDQEAIAYEAGLRQHNSMYDDMISHDFVFAHAPNIKSFTLLNSFWAPVLRLLYPKDILLFTYPEEWRPDFQKYLRDRYDTDRMAFFTVNGFADIARGVGFATRRPLLANGMASAIGVQTIKHELAHLENCGTWHDEQQGLLKHPVCQDCMIIRKIADHQTYPWCSE